MSRMEEEESGEETSVRQRLEGQAEKVLRESRNRHAAELAARTDLSQDQLNAVRLERETPSPIALYNQRFLM